MWLPARSKIMQVNTEKNHFSSEKIFFFLSHPSVIFSERKWGRQSLRSRPEADPWWTRTGRSTFLLLAFNATFVGKKQYYSRRTSLCLLAHGRKGKRWILQQSQAETGVIETTAWVWDELQPKFPTWTTLLWTTRRLQWIITSLKIMAILTAQVTQSY